MSQVSVTSPRRARFVRPLSVEVRRALQFLDSPDNEVWPPRRRHPPARGFNLIEILVVIALIGLIVSVIGANVFGVFRGGQGDIARQQAGELARACELHRLRHGAYPTTSDGLVVLTLPPQPIVRALPLDPWKRPFHYAFPGTKSAAAVDVWSAGEDGVDGSDDDVGNW